MEIVLHPRSEIDARIKKLQRQMGDITGVMLFGSVDLCYFSGTAQEGLLYVPRDSNPILMIRKSLQRAKEESPLDVSPLRGLKSLKADLQITSDAVIGLELDILPFNNYSRLAHVLGDAKLVDISEIVKHIRSVKSNFEISLIKAAAGMVDHGIESVQEHLIEGMCEIELACKVEAEMRDMGHQGIVRFRRFNHIVPLGHLMSGLNAAHPSFVASPSGGKGVSLLNPQGPGFKKIKRNEPVFVDYAGVYNGYIADETRIFSIGSLSQELEDAHLAALQIQEAIAQELRPGKIGRDLFSISESLGIEKGYGDHLGGPPGGKCGFVGHGVGLELDDYPVLGPVDHVIKPNMTIALEPKMIYPKLGVVGIEDTFQTTTDGAQRLTRLQQEIWRV
jgi:Xaa-Pro dipeptidase